MDTRKWTQGEIRARAYLSRVYRMEREVNWKCEQIAALGEMATSATARLGRMPRSDSPDLQRMETLVCRIADLKRELKADESALEAARVDTALMILKIPGERCQRLLTERYLQSRSWKEIADALGYSLSHTFGLHEDALCRMEALLAKEGVEP